MRDGAVDFPLRQRINPSAQVKTVTALPGLGNVFFWANIKETRRFRLAFGEREA
jgi:hypothetical protein